MRKLSVVGIAIGCAALAVSAVAGMDPQGAYRKKYVAFGWANSYLTPQDFIDHVAEFEKTPLDGVGVNVLGDKAAGRRYQCFREIVGKPRWTRESLADMVEPLRRMTSYRCFRESFVSGWMPPKKRLAWTDDEAWSVASNNLRCVAWLAREGNLRGMSWDIEDYTNQKQFFRRPGDPAYDELLELARRRGREIFGGVFEEFPNITMFMYWLLSDAPYRHVEVNLPDVMRARGDLWFAFVNGILDVLPPTATLVDGEEDGYRFEAARRDYLVTYTRIFNWDLPLIAEENRVKYLSQVSPSVGQYLDMYMNTDPKSAWYFGPVDGSKLKHIAMNVRQATSASKEYVWFWSEKGMWAHWSQELRDDPERLCRGAKYVWDDVLPGVNRLLKSIKDPDGYLRPNLERLIADGRLRSLLACESMPTWKEDAPKGSDGRQIAAPGRFFKDGKDLCAEGVAYGGCYNQMIENVAPGTIFFVKGRIKGERATVGANFKDENARWVYGPKYLLAPGRPDAEGWREVAAFFEIPANGRHLSLTLSVNSQEPGDVARFRDFGLYNVTASEAWPK